jgi:hypothetical protein
VVKILLFLNLEDSLNGDINTCGQLCGNIFSYKCKLSQTVQYHTWNVLIKPDLRSGLAAPPIRPQVAKTISTFHHNVLRAMLKLSHHLPIAPLYFLLGELPLEASLHLDVLSLFWNVWTNPQTKAYEVVKYLLKMSDNSACADGGPRSPSVHA